jgi:hypothetical protein
MKDLFGREVTIEEQARGIRTGERASERAYRILIQEYGVTEGKKCLHCKHLIWKSYSKKYPKCGLTGMNTASRATDWSSQWLACGKFQ